MSARMKPLETFDRVQEIPSATTPTLYEVRLVEGKWTCTCQFAKVHPGLDCRHALEAQLRIVTAERDIAVDGYVNEALMAYEEIVERVSFFRKAECNRLAGLALSLAASHPEHTVTADDIHAAVGERFDGDSRIIGPVWTTMARKGLLRFRDRQPTKRGHGRMIIKYDLTERGLAVARGLAVDSGAVEGGGP